MARSQITVSPAPFDPAAAYGSFAETVPGAGAIVSFTGLVRAGSPRGAVTDLTLQAYAPLTEPGIAAAAEEAGARWPLQGIRIIHRIGSLSPKDPIVFVATASEHRRAAFEAADFLMDYLKTEAVFWKKETTDAGAVWIEPRPEDYSDRARWMKAPTR